MLVSVCIPCYCSAKTITPVVQNITAEFKKHPEYDYEIILANDGSPDNTFDVIRELCANDSHVTGINLSRNFGQGQALCALYRYIRGDMAVFMDDDGQHPAEGIFMLLEQIEAGYDVAIAKFVQKKHSWFKRFTSKMQRNLSEYVGTCPKDIVYSSFTAWSRICIDAVQEYNSPFPSIGAYLMNITTRFVNVEMPHQDRMEGSSGYNLRKLLSLSLTALTSFSIVPLRFASFLGSVIAVLGFLVGIVTVFRKLLYPDILAGYTSLLSVLFLIGGVLMLLLGLIGEYLGRIYMTVSGKPQFLLREIVGASQKVEEPVTTR